MKDSEHQKEVITSEGEIMSPPEAGYTYAYYLKKENERLRLALKTIREMEEKKTCSHSIASSWSVADNALNHKGFGCD